MFMMVLVMVTLAQADAIYLEHRTIIPTEPIPGDPKLFMKNCNLGSIPKDAFLTYSNLSMLLFERTGIRYIEEGAFNGLDKLVSFCSISNWNLQLPSDFGPPTKTLTTLVLYETLPVYQTPVFPYFAAFKNLKTLTIGGSFASYQIENLPSDLTEIGLQYTLSSTFPNLGIIGAMLKVIVISGCGMRSIIPEHMVGLNEVTHFDLLDNKLTAIPDISFMRKLELLRLERNRLSSIPDLYDIPLTTLALANNPLVCDTALCWIRMLPWVKPSSPIPTDSPVCAGPVEVSGMELMKVDPAFMKCFNGKFCHLILRALVNIQQVVDHMP